jgi:drug/metabolite transporter (DMT)-like permease
MAWIQIHACVVLWGFTAILGKLISLPALPLVWWRMLLVAGALALLPRVWRGLGGLPGRLLLIYAGIGVLVALHWLTFYGAIKLANASVAASCMALATVFVAIIEPLLTGSRFSRFDLAVGVVVLPGVALVVGGVPEPMRAGIAVGVISALLVAVFGALNKRYVVHADPLTVTALELGAGALLLTVLAPLMPRLFPTVAGSLFAVPAARDIGLLLLLAFGCTLLPFTLSLVALRSLSAFGAQLAVNLEPVYAITLAILLLGEQRELTPWFYLGVAVILAAVLAHPWFSPPQRLEHPEQLAMAESKHIAD